MAISNYDTLITSLTTYIEDNTTGSVTPSDIRTVLTGLIDTMFGMGGIVAIDNTDSPYTVDYGTDRFILCDTSSAAITVAPPAVATNANQSVYIMCLSASFDVTIDPADSNINGASSITLSGAYASAYVINNGTVHYAFLSG